MAIDAKPLPERKFVGDLDHCTAVAKAAGLTLAFGWQEIQLRPADKSWFLKIYPQNGRLYWNNQRPGRFLTLKDNYGLIDIINAAIEAVKGD